MTEEFYEPKPIVDEDDLILEWDDFKKKYPNVSQEEYELMVKEFQEM